MSESVICSILPTKLYGVLNVSSTTKFYDDGKQVHALYFDAVVDSLIFEDPSFSFTLESSQDQIISTFK